MKKSSFSDTEYVNLLPNEADIATKDGGKYLPIEVVERDLDRWAWGTQNFSWQQFRDKFGNLCVGASLELVIPWKNEDGEITERRLTGGCNFIILAYFPNKHFIAIAKSECVKNAASDLGPKFGRGLNDDVVPEDSDIEPAEKVKPKMKPDPSIMRQYLESVEKGDDAKIAQLCDIYEIKTPQS